MKMNMRLLYGLAITIALISTMATARAATIVNWGASGGDTGIIATGDSSADNTSINTTYTPGTDITDGTGYYGGYNSSLHSPTFNGAASHSRNLEVRSGTNGDYFSHPYNFGSTTGGTQTFMFAWESSQMVASPTGLTLDSFDFEFKSRGNHNSGTVRLLIKSGSQWYISDDSQNIATAYSTWSGNFSSLTWNGFTPFSGGTESIGAAATPSLGSVDAVGFYGNVSHTAGSNWAEIRTRYFNVTAVPEPMTMLAVGLALGGLGGYVRKRRRA